MLLDFSRCRDVWVPPNETTGTEGFWSPPHPHVKYGVEQIIAHPFFLLADDMGGMKTAQTIIAAQFMHDMDIIDRVIVVAPAAVRPTVWYDADLGQLREQVWNDKRNRVTEFHTRVRTWVHGPETAKELRWIITNYEFIRARAVLNALLPYCGPRTLLVLDESSAVRGYDSAQTEACMHLRWRQSKRGRPVLGAPRCGRVLLLNGTPIADTPLDMFAQGNIMHPAILDCKYITHYKIRYAVQEPVLHAGGEAMTKVIGKGKFKKEIVIQHTTGWANLEDLQRRFAPYVLRREAKALGIDFALPPVALTVPLTKTTWKAYCDMRDEMVIWLQENVAAAKTAAVRSIRLAQITSGFVGGVEESRVEEIEPGLLESLDLGGGYDTGGAAGGDRPGGVGGGAGDCEGGGALYSGARCDDAASDEPRGKVPSGTHEIGREKLDFALEWHAELLRRYPDMKLLTWCRFVPELRRYLAEVQRFGHPVGAACGEKVLVGEHNKKYEREFALRLLHPKTAPPGPATVGATSGTGALGLNFTACRTVLDMSYDFSPWKKLQGDSRVNRPGQTGPVSFFYLVAVGPRGQKTIDHHILMHRLGKTNVNDWTVSAWVRALQEE